MKATTPQARAAETRRLRRAQEQRAYWETTIFPTTADMYDDGLLPYEVRGGDLATALEEAIRSICEAMTIAPSEDDWPLTSDYALFHQGRILAIVQCGIHGPVVTRLEPQAHA